MCSNCAVSVCLPVQGFPDTFRFASGDYVPGSNPPRRMTQKQQIRYKYKQVGNAVPPPLAAALGAKLREALQHQQHQQQQ